MSTLRDIILATWHKAIEKTVTIAGLTVIFQEESGPRPPKPYVAIKIISGPTPVGSLDDIRREPGTQNRFVISGLRRYTLNVQALGVEALEILGDLQTSMDDPDFQALLRNEDIDMAVTDRGSVDDITELLDTGYEARASLDIGFHAAVNKVIDPGVIEKIEYAGTISNGDDLIITGTVPEN